MQKLDIPLNNIMKLGPLLRNLFVVQGICDDVGRKFITYEIYRLPSETHSVVLKYF
jgi:hypothetical protein